MNIFLWLSAAELEYGVSSFIKYIFISSALFFLIRSSYFLNNSLNSKTSYTLKLFFIFYSILILVGSFRFEKFYFQELFAERYFFIPYLIPLFFMFMRVDLDLIKRLLKITGILLLPAVVCQFLFASIFFSPEKYFFHLTSIFLFSLAPTLLLLNSQYFKSKYYFFIALIYLLLNLYLSAAWGRRGWFIINIIILCIYLFGINTKKMSSVASHKLILIFSILTITIFIYIFYFAEISNLYIFERGINAQGLEDSRGSVFQDYKSDFNTFYDYIFGRGLNGTISREIFIEGNGRARFIEIGYLNFLLKGGLLYLCPMLLLFLRSFYLGIFRSNNTLSKSFSFIILLQLIEMTTFGVADFSSTYCIIWLSFAANVNSNLRLLTDSQISLFFRNYN